MHVCSIKCQVSTIKLKSWVKIWLAEKKHKEIKSYEKLEAEIALLIKQSLDIGHNTELGTRLKLLESERNKLLMEEEERWRLKSRATWIQCGDKNTKYFHNFASHRRNKKHLWEIKDDQDQVHHGQEAIKMEAKRFFSSFYQESTQNSIVDQVESVRLYPRLVSDEDIIILEKVVTKEEVLEVLKGFTKDKIPGPDGWTVEFFISLL
jgi:hypothetical protein